MSRRETFFQASRFAIVGGACFAAGVLILYVLTDLGGLHYLLSMSVALVSGSFLGWILNRTWTFRSDAADTGMEFFRYLGVNIGAYIATLLLMGFLVSGLGVNYIVASVVIAFAMMFANFLIHRAWSFRRGDH
ncbi:MAG: GtrA family protein [Prolixibacteraceae bacterium]|nr:GtrA family protein [Burkholderiales bacterium]